MLASGTIREHFFYQCLAHHLGAAFIDGEIALGAGARYPHAVHAGLAPWRRWLPLARRAARSVAYPSLGKGARRRALGRAPCDHDTFALVQLGARGGDGIDLREANLGLANLDPSLSAKERPSHAQCTFAMAAATTTLAFGLAPAFTLTVVSLSMTCFFLASIWLRLFAGAASTACGHEPFRARVEDRRLPVYSVVVALHREARVVAQLAAALAAIDYPRGIAGLGLPLPLGGSSNHFRTEVLREVCGWDAWNVTEDADLGLRLARFGYGVGILPSSTQEEAPALIDAWLRQRRRWSKGWNKYFAAFSFNGLNGWKLKNLPAVATPSQQYFHLLALSRRKQGSSRLIAYGAQHLPDKRSRTSTNLVAVQRPIL